MGPPTTLVPGAPVAPRKAERGGDCLLERVGLTPLMELTAGSPKVVVGVIDGPVAGDHPDLAMDNIRTLPGRPAACAVHDASCLHGTFVTGILGARRGADVPAICPGCTLLLRPVFGPSRRSAHDMPSATPREVAAAMRECIEGGARILNISAALMDAGASEQRRELTQTLDLAASRGVVVVVAAGNQRTITGSALTGHPWALPVVAYTRTGRPMETATLGRSIGRQGLGAPGERVTSLAPGGERLQFGGSSAAAPFVTGAAALIWSRFPGASGAEIRFVLTASARRRRRSVVPPMLDAWSAHQRLAASGGGRPHG